MGGGGSKPSGPSVSDMMNMHSKNTEAMMKMMSENNARAMESERAANERVMGLVEKMVQSQNNDAEMLKKLEAKEAEFNRMLAAQGEEMQNLLFKKQEEADAMRAKFEADQRDWDVKMGDVQASHMVNMAKAQEEADRLAGELAETEEEKQLIKASFEKKSIEHNYRMDFPMAECLRLKKNTNPSAIFIQVLGNTGVGKSSLFNSILGLEEEDEVFKSGATETTVETDFYDITNVVKSLCPGQEIPKVFLCDQPGIGGIKISAQSYFETFTPGHYDFTVFCSASRLTENEIWLTKHLDNYQKDYMVVRTKVDSDLMKKTKGLLNRHKKFEEYLQELKNEFNQYLLDNIPTLEGRSGDELCLYSGLPFDDYDGDKVRARLMAKVLNEIRDRKIANAMTQQ